MNHYEILEPVLGKFFEMAGVIHPIVAQGVLAAHGDKAYQYRTQFEKAGLEFHEGVAIYLLSYYSPFSKEVRETSTGWVAPVDWVCSNKDRFQPLLKEAIDGVL